MPFKVNWKGYPQNSLLETTKGIKWVSYPNNRRLYKAHPEELVRLQTVHFLFEQMKVPRVRDAIEVELKMSEFDYENTDRADIVINALDSEGFLVPILVVECKANHIELTKQVFDQAVKYDYVLHANNIMITNGKILKLYYFDIAKQSYVVRDRIPSYYEMVRKAKLYPIE